MSISRQAHVCEEHLVGGIGSLGWIPCLGLSVSCLSLYYTFARREDVADGELHVTV